VKQFSITSTNIRKIAYLDISTHIRESRQRENLFILHVYTQEVSIRFEMS